MTTYFSATHTRRPRISMVAALSPHCGMIYVSSPIKARAQLDRPCKDSSLSTHFPHSKIHWGVLLPWSSLLGLPLLEGNPQPKPTEKTFARNYTSPGCRCCGVVVVVVVGLMNIPNHIRWGVLARVRKSRRYWTTEWSVSSTSSSVWPVESMPN